MASSWMSWGGHGDAGCRLSGASKQTGRSGTRRWESQAACDLDGQIGSWCSRVQPASDACGNGDTDCFNRVGEQRRLALDWAEERIERVRHDGRVDADLFGVAVQVP